MYYDYTPAERADIEAALDPVVEWFWSTESYWPLNKYGVRGAWAIFHNDRTRIDDAKADYRNQIFYELTSDGVFNSAMGYAHGRLAGSRDAKAHFLDVPRIHRRGQRPLTRTLVSGISWNGSGVTRSRPSTRCAASATPTPTAAPNGVVSAALRAYRFSSDAASYAAWVGDGKTPKGRLLDYVLHGEHYPDPVRAPSRIFEAGGGVAPGARDGHRNPRRRPLEPHLHRLARPQGRERRRLLGLWRTHPTNSGYAGANDSALGYSWTTFTPPPARATWSSIGDADHVDKKGNGIAEGILAPTFDYASGDDGPAIANGSHLRNLLFVHTDANANGYWILLDETDANSASDDTRVLIHPNSDEITAAGANTEYTWRIGSFHTDDPAFDTDPANDGIDMRLYRQQRPRHRLPRHGTNLLQHSQGRPRPLWQRVLRRPLSRLRVPLRHRREGSRAHRRLPHDDTPPQSRHGARLRTGYTGARITQGATIDTVVESDGSGAHTIDGLTFQGLAAWWRTVDGATSASFARKATSLDEGNGVGFECASPVSWYRSGRTVWIVSPGADVKILYPGLQSIEENAATLSPVGTGSGWVTVTSPPATTNSPSTPANPGAAPSIPPTGPPASKTPRAASSTTSLRGYHQKPRPIPDNPPGATYDVTQSPYNADNTGTTDATAAIQQAIDAAQLAGGGIVYLPAGTYGVQPDGSDSWALHIDQSGVVLRGDGPGQTFCATTPPTCARRASSTCATCGATGTTSAPMKPPSPRTSSNPPPPFTSPTPRPSRPASGSSLKRRPAAERIPRP